MKRTTIWIWGLAALLGVFSFHACKKAEVETATLTVIVSAGVSGSPAAGEYAVEVGDERTYAFSLEAGYEKLTVLLDGTAVAASGSFAIRGNHTLQAYADDNLQYKLTVTVNEGVSGTPATGTYLYKQGTQVPYAYALADGYTSLSVKLDGIETTTSGTITMSKDSSLYAIAYVKNRLPGSWSLSESYNDGSGFEVVATFTGTLFGGTVTDSEGGSGTYEFLDDSVDFTLVFPDVTYVYTGSFSDADTMGGTCKRYQTEDNVSSGTWTATRIFGAATVPGRVSGTQGKARRSQ